MKEQWVLSKINIPEGPQEFQVLWSVMTVRQFIDKIVPDLESMQNILEIDWRTVEQNLLREYGEKHAHVVAIVNGPDADTDFIRQILEDTRTALRGPKNRSVTILFHQLLFEALKKITNIQYSSLN